MAKRSILDLYVRGHEFEIDDGNGDVVKVWLQKMNPIENAAAVRGADAARARVLAVKHDEDSDEFMALKSDILAADREAMIGILSAIERGRIQPLSDAEKAMDEEWREDNYLEGLRYSWDESLRERYVDDPEDKEAKRVFDEINRFLAVVEQDVDDKILAFEEGLATMTNTELQERLLDHNIKTSSDFAWMNEYYRQEVFRSVRDGKNHKEKVFSTRSEVDELQLETYQAIHAALRELLVEPAEGKDLAATPPSSASSEQSEAQATEQPSGQQGATT